MTDTQAIHEIQKVLNAYAHDRTPDRRKDLVRIRTIGQIAEIAFKKCKTR